MKKHKKFWWPRLTATPQKPAWLKVHFLNDSMYGKSSGGSEILISFNLPPLQIDFERWKSEDGDEDEEVRDVINDYPDLYKNLHKEETGYIKGKLLTCTPSFQ